ICHQLNTKNNIISGSEVSRLSVAIQSSFLSRLLQHAYLSAMTEVNACYERGLAQMNRPGLLRS
ncbi:hypothetical protein KXZ56_23495, partial [Escherichia coli]|uniref:hypothetical protein n=1 Tax=Escherichia coli TaxID=562 RepID=UPI001CA4436D